jgi:type I restriction enzyme S subunit
MNKIEQLLEKYCHDGIEFKTIQELIDEKKVLTVSPPKKLSKKDYKNNGIFPIVDQGQNFIIGYTDDENIVLEK